MEDEFEERERERAELLLGTPEVWARRSLSSRRPKPRPGAALLVLLVGAFGIAWGWNHLVAALEKAPSTPGAGASASCAELRVTYPHGVAREGARDEIESGEPQVLTYAVMPDVYSANRRLDTDGDGIACERH